MAGRLIILPLLLLGYVQLVSSQSYSMSASEGFLSPAPTIHEKSSHSSDFSMSHSTTGPPPVLIDDDPGITRDDDSSSFISMSYNIGPPPVLIDDDPVIVLDDDLNDDPFASYALSLSYSFSAFVPWPEDVAASDTVLLIAADDLPTSEDASFLRSLISETTGVPEEDMFNFVLESTEVEQGRRHLTSYTWTATFQIVVSISVTNCGSCQNSPQMSVFIQDTCSSPAFNTQYRNHCGSCNVGPVRCKPRPPPPPRPPQPGGGPPPAPATTAVTPAPAPTTPNPISLPTSSPSFPPSFNPTPSPTECIWVCKKYDCVSPALAPAAPPAPQPSFNPPLGSPPPTAAMGCSVNQTSSATEGSSVKLDCSDRKVIKVEESWYGVSLNECMSGCMNTTKVLKNRCSGQATCTQKASNAAFGNDPARGSYKFLVVKYCCE